MGGTRPCVAAAVALTVLLLFLLGLRLPPPTARAELRTAAEVFGTARTAPAHIRAPAPLLGLRHREAQPTPRPTSRRPAAPAAPHSPAAAAALLATAAGAAVGLLAGLSRGSPRPRPLAPPSRPAQSGSAGPPPLPGGLCCAIRKGPSPPWPSSEEALRDRHLAFVVLAVQRVIDSHLHVWSNGKAPYKWLVEPPEELESTATFDAMAAMLREAGVSGALVVQPVNHAFDHRYLVAALKAHPDLLRGMGLADGDRGIAHGLAQLDRMRKAGFVGVHFNPVLFSTTIDGSVGRAMYNRAGQLDLVVGLMCFTSFLPQAHAAELLLREYPSTQLVVDHLGLFRQPPTGGLLGDVAENDEKAWKALLALARHPQVFVKVSAFFRTSAELWPHRDLRPRLEALVKAFGSERLMWGSDWPYVELGGKTRNAAGVPYGTAVQTLAALAGDLLSPKQLDDIMYGTARRLFRFPEP